MEALPLSFCAALADVVGPELVGHRLVKISVGWRLAWGVIVATEALRRTSLPATLWNLVARVARDQQAVIRVKKLP